MLNGKEYHIPKDYLIYRVTGPKTDTSAWLLALWPDLEPFYDGAKPRQAGRTQVENTISILLMPDVGRTSLDYKFAALTRAGYLAPSDVVSHTQGGDTLRYYIRKPEAPRHGFEVEILAFFRNEQLDKFVECDAPTTNSAVPSCKLYFENASEQFRVHFSKAHLEDVEVLQNRVVALRDSLLKSSDPRAN